MAVEPTACPTLTKGAYTYDFGDTAGLTPLILMYTLGHSFVPSGIHAGGLRYHGDAPLLCQLVHEKVIEARAYAQNPVFEAARLFAETEGIIPAPETAHAIRAAVDEALVCKETNQAKCIVFNLSGHGHFDLAAYDGFLEGQLKDIELDPSEMIKKALANLPKIKGTIKPSRPERGQADSWRCPLFSRSLMHHALGGNKLRPAMYECAYQ